jgi:hypothetical protein
MKKISTKLIYSLYNKVAQKVDISEYHEHSNKSALDKITDAGDGTKYLANDGNYKTVVGGGGSATWGSITGILSNQTDLQSALNGKSDITHSHAINDVTNLQTTLDNLRNDVDGKAPTSHTHTKSQITDFAHTHAISDVTNLQTSLNGKADVSHNHDDRYFTETECWTNFEGKFNYVLINDGSGYEVSYFANTMILLDLSTFEDPTRSIEFAYTGNSNDNGGICIIKVKRINSVTSQTLNFNNVLDETGSNITLTSTNNGQTFIFAYQRGYWRTVYSDISKQDKLISGTNIKTINSQSILGSGNLTIGGVSDAIRILTSNETKTNDTNMQGWFNSNNRLLLDANSIYEFFGSFHSSNGSTSHGLNMQFDAMTNCSIRWNAIGAKVNDTTQATALRYTSTNTFNTARNVTTASTVTGNVVEVWGIIITGSTQEYFAPKVAQTAASGSFTALAGTFMRIRKLGTNTDTNIGGWTT